MLNKGFLNGWMMDTLGSKCPGPTVVNISGHLIFFSVK